MNNLQRTVSEQGIWQEYFLASLEERPVKMQEIQENPAGAAAASAQEQTHQETGGTSETRNRALFFPLERLNAVEFQRSLSMHQATRVRDVALKVFQSHMREFNDFQGVCLAYTGSDGRDEKLSPYSSPMELMFIVRKQADLNPDTLAKIQALVLENPHLFLGDIEVRCLDTDSLICFNRNLDWRGPKEDRAFPTRAMDARYLIGDDAILKEFRVRSYQQIQDPANKKHFDHFGTDSVRKTVKLLKDTCEGTQKENIDLARNLTFYDGERIKGTKYPFLRAVQYKLALYICKQIQQKTISEDAFLSMPFSTIERIQWLAERDMLKMNPDQCKKIQKSYAASLIWFGITQKNFEVHGETQTSLPPDDLQEVARTIATFCQSKSIFA